jgi:SAM-dependent methyltransferase
MENSPPEIPPKVDFRNPAVARKWTDEAASKRPARDQFFQLFANQLASLGQQDISVLELGSGPGFLAERILQAMPHAEYTALDFSPAMHDLARERLGKFSGGVRFVEANFTAPDWNLGLPAVDAVVSMQSVHEVRHKANVPALYASVRTVLRRGGLFLVCDHYAGEDAQSDTALYMTLQEQHQALVAARFSDVKMLLQDSGLALWRARDAS